MNKDLEVLKNEITMKNENLKELIKEQNQLFDDIKLLKERFVKASRTVEEYLNAFKDEDCSVFKMRESVELIKSFYITIENNERYQPDSEWKRKFHFRINMIPVDLNVVGGVENFLKFWKEHYLDPQKGYMIISDEFSAVVIDELVWTKYGYRLSTYPIFRNIIIKPDHLCKIFSYMERHYSTIDFEIK